MYVKDEKVPKSNKVRTEQTRTELIAAARALFVEKGYADTATPDIVAAAGMTRGALYHHFEDKKALLRAVVEHESRLVAEAIEAAPPAGPSPMAALAAGGSAFLDAMQEPGRTRLLLLDGPAVLGRHEMDRIDAETGGTKTLHQGLAAAMRASELKTLPLAALAALLSAAFDRAALEIASGGDRAAYEKTLQQLVAGLATKG
jgi:AcrR family transcriptional regulator